MTTLITTSNKANCIAFIRRGHTAEFRAANFSVAKANPKKSLGGDLIPQRSKRSYVAIFDPGLSQSKCLALLAAAAKFVEKTKRLKLSVVSVEKGGGKVELETPVAMTFNACPELMVQNAKQLSVTSPDLPWGMLVLFGSVRDWREVLDDLSGLQRRIAATGLLRGHLSTEWGPVELHEVKKRGIIASIVEPARGTFYDDDDEDDDEFDHV